MEIGKSLIVLLALVATSVQIYVPDDAINQKPLTNSQGIQTWPRRPNQLQVDHNYSKVYSHNNSTISSDSDDENDSKRLYPIYNAHAYGARPPAGQSHNARLVAGQSQVYVINGTRIAKKANPIRQIVAFNKAKRSPKIQIRTTCPTDATGQFVYVASCNQFLNCWRGRGSVQNCAPGTLFNPQTLECDFPVKVTCVSGPREDILSQERSADVRQIGCPNDFSGLIPNYTDCAKFINCVSGIENFMDCPPGTLFDADKNICDFAHKAACFNGQNDNLKNDADDGRDSGANVQREEWRFKSGEVRCPDGVQGLVSHPTDCAKFLNCDHGQTFVQDCAPGTLFNPIVKICDFPYNVRCGSGTNSGSTLVGDEYSGGSHGTHGSGQYGTSGNHGQSLDNQAGTYGNRGHNLDNGGTNSYNKGTSHTYYDNSGYGGGTQNVYNGGRAPSFSSTSDNRYENTNFAKGRGHVGYQNPQYSGTVNENDNPYNADSNIFTSTNRYRDNDGYRPGGTVNSYGSASGQNVHNQQPEYSSSYPSRPNSGQNSGIYVQGSGQYYRPYSTSSSQQDPVKGHYITRPNRLGEDQYNNGENVRTTVPYNRGAYDSGDNQYGTYGQNTWPVSNARSENGNVYGTTGSQIGSYDVNSYDTKGLRGTYDQSSYSGTPGIKSFPSTYNQNSYSDTSNFDRDRSTGGTYGHNSQDIYGTKGFGGTYGQNSWADTSGNQNTYGTKGYGDTFSQNSWPGTHTIGDNRDTPGIQGPSGTYGHNAWAGTRNVDQNRNVYGMKGESGTGDTYGGTYSSNSGSTDQNRNTKGYSWSGSPSFDGNTNHLYDKGVPDGTHTHNQYPDRVVVIPGRNRGYSRPSDDTTANYDQVVHINHHRTTPPVPSRNPYEPFFGTTQKTGNDYDDYRPNYSQKYVRSTTQPILEKHWPPPFPSTDVNADYVFEYEDPDVTLEAENSDSGKTRDGDCAKFDFLCQNRKCISKTLVCDGARDCPDGRDEQDCLQYVSKFEVQKNKKLAILEKERWDNVSIAACAVMCVQNQKFKCRSFNYRKIDKTCFLTNTNEGLTGAIISYYPFDYYELTSDKINCTGKFSCPNRKCIDRAQICDGKDDCGDRTDEKSCKSEDMGYHVRLTGSRSKHEGFIEVTAFGKTGFVCDDKFGLNDANVVCKELGYSLGASEVKGNSFFAKGAKNETPFYMMDDVTCGGNETRLLDCDFSGWGIHNCLGQEIAGVVCKTPTEKCASDYWQCDTGQECLPLAFVCDGLLDCTDGSDEGSQHCDAPTQIRLVNGTNQSQGRVEIRHHGTWGSICDDDFNEDAAKVICRQLGYKGSAVVKKDAFFGSGLGPIWLDQVFCSGNETGVEECSHWNWGEHNCDHSEDVGVICSNTNNYEERHSHQVAAVWKPIEYPEKCGFRSDNIFNRGDDVHFRVVKGSLAKKGDYPWQAAVRVKGKTSTSHWCGAVIVSEKFVLTAAHCLIGYAKGAYVIVAGDYNVDEEEGTEQEAHIEDYYLHEDFRRGHKMNNDIALVKLKGRGFRFTDHVQAICLPDADTSYETGQNCTISGFGSIESGKSAFSHNLRAGWIPLQKREICTMPHVYGDALTEGMICAGSLDEGIDSCDGDSGGPLACLYRGVFTLYGITSWGQHCGYANKPGVYVKVAHYRQWIDDTFKKYS